MIYRNAKWGTQQLQYNPEAVDCIVSGGHVVRSDVGGQPTVALMGDVVKEIQFRAWLAGGDAKTCWEVIDSQFNRKDFIVLELDWPGLSWVVPRSFHSAEKPGSMAGNYLYQYLIRSNVIGAFQDYKRSFIFDYNLYTNDFGLEGTCLIPYPFGSVNHSQTATVTRKGEAGNIPCVYATKPVLTFDLSEENRVLGNLSVAKSGQETIINTQMLKIRTREDESTNKSRLDISYWDEAHGKLRVHWVFKR